MLRSAILMAGRQLKNPLKLSAEEVGSKVGRTYLRLKDSNAVVGAATMQHRRRQKSMTDRQTDKLFTHYSKMSTGQRRLFPPQRQEATVFQVASAALI